MRFWITIGLVLVLSAVGLTHEIAAGRVLAPFFGGMPVGVVLTFFPASVFVSLPSPFLAKLAVEARPGPEGSSPGLILAAGSLGAIMGAILAGFAALPLAGSTATFAACGAAVLLYMPFVRGGPPGGHGDQEQVSGRSSRRGLMSARPVGRPAAPASGRTPPRSRGGG